MSESGGLISRTDTPAKTNQLPITIIGGGKGGTGKSVVAMALVDYALRRGQDVLLVETDTTNPDVGKLYNSSTQVGVHFLDLSKHEGWLTLIDLCAANPHKRIIVNSKGGNSEDVSAFGLQLNDALTEIGPGRIATWWVINLYLDAVIALREFRKTISNMPIHVLLNECWGVAADFDVYNGSAERKAIECVAGKSLLFPRVANRILKATFNDRQALDAQYIGATLGTRSEIDNWRRKTSAVFDELLERASDVR